jgi:hypothetical protein
LEINKLLLLHLVGFLYYFTYTDDGFGGLAVSMLDSGTQEYNMAQGSSAVRPTNGLYLYLLPTLTMHGQTQIMLKGLDNIKIKLNNARKFVLDITSGV